MLVSRTPHGFRSLGRDEASTIQKCLIDGDRDPDWLFTQCQRIADALDNGEIALAQIYSLRIPIGDLDDRQLRRIALAGLAKAGFNRDEPRVRKGDPHGGEWTDGGGSDIASDGSAVTSGDGTAETDSGPGRADTGSPPAMEYSIAPGGSDESSSRTPATAETPSNSPEASAPVSPVDGSPLVPLGTVAAEADAAATSLLGQLPPETIAGLTELAARMTAATMVFRILFIPSNGSAVVEGRVANTLDVSYRYDRDTGIVQVWQDDGTGGRTLLDTGRIGVDGRFYDQSGRVIGRALSNAVVVDPDAFPGYQSQSRSGAEATARPLALADTAGAEALPRPDAGEYRWTLGAHDRLSIANHRIAAGLRGRIQRRAI